MTYGLCNPEYYRGTFLEIQKFMEVREEGMEVQEETVALMNSEKKFGPLRTPLLICSLLTFILFAPRF